MGRIGLGVVLFCLVGLGVFFVYSLNFARSASEKQSESDNEL